MKIKLDENLPYRLVNSLKNLGHEEWKQEIARRIEELDSSKVKPIAWAEARRQISAILHGG